MRAFVLLLVFGLAACGGEPREPVAAPPVDMTQVLADAAADGRNVLIEYTSESCNFCEQMDSETHTDVGVKAALEGVVYVRLHQDRNAEWFESRWDGMGTPTFVVLKPDGTQIGKSLTGVIKAPDFVRFVDWAKSGDGEPPAIKPGGS